MVPLVSTHMSTNMSSLARPAMRRRSICQCWGTSGDSSHGACVTISSAETRLDLGQEAKSQSLSQQFQLPGPCILFLWHGDFTDCDPPVLSTPFYHDAATAPAISFALHFLFTVSPNAMFSTSMRTQVPPFDQPLGCAL